MLTIVENGCFICQEKGFDKIIQVEDLDLGFHFSCWRSSAGDQLPADCFTELDWVKFAGEEWSTKYFCKISVNGTKEWFSEDGTHRECGPAIIRPDGQEEWFVNDVPHREGGPAIVYPDGEEEWFLNGKYHREDGPAVTCYNKYFLHDKEFPSEEAWRIEKEKLND